MKSPALASLILTTAMAFSFAPGLEATQVELFPPRADRKPALRTRAIMYYCTHQQWKTYKGDRMTSILPMILFMLCLFAAPLTSEAGTYKRIQRPGIPKGLELYQKVSAYGIWYKLVNTDTQRDAEMTIQGEAVFGKSRKRYQYNEDCSTAPGRNCKIHISQSDSYGKLKEHRLQYNVHYTN